MPIGDATPPGNDAIWVELRAQKQLLQQLFAQASGAKNIATAVQTGLGTLAGSGTTWAGPVASPSTISSAGDLTVGGLIRNSAAYSNPITTSFRNLFVTSIDGQFGFNLSSAKFKQDIETARVSPADVLKLRLVTYRYIAAVEALGDAAEVEWGFIAEEVEAAGLGWLVDYDENGDPLTLKFHLIGMAMLVVNQDQAIAITEIRRENAELRARLDAAGL